MTVPAPPPEFVRPPPIPVIEHILTPAEVDSECRAVNAVRGWKRPDNRVFLGCILIAGDPREGPNFGKDVCIMWRIADDDVKRHEWAHCAGWRHLEELERIKP